MDIDGAMAITIITLTFYVINENDVVDDDVTIWKSKIDQRKNDVTHPLMIRRQSSGFNLLPEDIAKSVPID